MGLKMMLDDGFGLYVFNNNDDGDAGLRFPIHLQGSMISLIHPSNAPNFTLAYEDESDTIDKPSSSLGWRRFASKNEMRRFIFPDGSIKIQCCFMISVPRGGLSVATVSHDIDDGKHHDVAYADDACTRCCSSKRLSKGLCQNTNDEQHCMACWRRWWERNWEA